MTFPNPLLIQKVNGCLRSDPQRILADPYGSGWLFAGWELPERTRAGLMGGPPAAAWQAEERELLATGNPRNAQTELRRRQSRARRGRVTVAATIGVSAPTLFFEHALGSKGITVKRNLLVFGIGMGLALVTGWTAFPRASYVRRDQPLEFHHKTHSEKSGLTQCDSCHVLGSDGEFKELPE